MRTSKHYQKDRIKRNITIEEIGEGIVVFDIVKWDSKRKGYYKYEITDNAILIVKPVEDENFIITKIIARPNRILQYWEACPTEILEKAIAHAKAKMYY